MVGIACYEIDLGLCHMHVKQEYQSLLPKLLEWTENELYKIHDGIKSLKIWITSNEPHKRTLLLSNNYEMVSISPLTTFSYKNSFSERKLPEGFKLIDGTMVDYTKLKICYFKGFNHGDNPDDDIDGTIHNCNAPIEPLATIPKYRRMGLATITLTEAMKKTKALGAEYCFGGSMDFYKAIGFETVCNWEL